MTGSESPGFLYPGTLSRLPRSLAGGAVLAWKTPDGVRLQLRRQIFTSGSAGGLVFAVVWGCFFIGHVAWHQMPRALIDWPFYVWMSPSIGLLFWFLASALRKATVEADRYHVRLVRSGIFGTRRQEWKESELEDIREEETDFFVNDERQHHLVFELTSGKKDSLFQGLSWESLNAVTAELRTVLWAPRPKDPASP